jgi:hypothetical protein
LDTVTDPDPDPELEPDSLVKGADPDPHQNVTDRHHCLYLMNVENTDPCGSGTR